MPAKNTGSQLSYTDLVASIERKHQVIRDMRPIRESAVKKYYDDFSVAACHNSTAIEGNTFTIDETVLLLREGVTSSNHSIKEHNEILGYGKGFWYVYECLKEAAPVSENLIKTIHSKTMLGEDFAGEYRDINVLIGQMMTDRVTFNPPAYTEIPKLMKEYIEQINNDLDTLKGIDVHNMDWGKLFGALANHHCEFERIHPFQDGNGRTGRLLLNYELIFLGLLPVDIRYAEKERYYAALKNYDSKSKYSTRTDSKTEGMAKLLMESELRSMNWWTEMFANFISK